MQGAADPMRKGSTPTAGDEAGPAKVGEFVADILAGKVKSTTAPLASPFFKAVTKPRFLAFWFCVFMWLCFWAGSFFLLVQENAMVSGARGSAGWSLLWALQDKVLRHRYSLKSGP